MKNYIVNYNGLSPDQLREQVLKVNGGNPVDIAIDLFGSDMKKLCCECVDVNGQVVTIVEETDPNYKTPLYPSISPRNLFGVNASFHLVFASASLFAAPRYWPKFGQHLTNLAKAVEDGKIRTRVEVVGNLSVETVVKAHKLLEEHHTKGKLVMKM